MADFTPRGQRKECRHAELMARWKLTLLEGMIDVEQRQMVSIDVSKPHLGLVCRLLSLRGADKTLWD